MPTCDCGENLNYAGECMQGMFSGGHQGNCVICGKSAFLDGLRCCSAECDQIAEVLTDDEILSESSAPAVTPPDPRGGGEFARRSRVVTVMNDHTISGTALRLHELIQSGIALRPIVAQHPDLFSALLEAAARADESGKSDLLIEIVARVACTGDRLAVADSHNAAEFAERILLADRAAEDLGDILRELVPERLPIGGEVSSSQASN